MSAILSADDLNDFISPGVACIKPIETLPSSPPPSSLEHEVILDGTPAAVAASSNLKQGAPAQISLTDCLACSGCVTSAEAVLVSLQSHTEMLSTLDAAPGIQLQTDGSGNTVIAAAKTPVEEEEDSKLFIATLAPQVSASIAAVAGCSAQQAENMVVNLLTNELGRGGKHGNNFAWVVSTEALNQAVLVLGAEEVTNPQSMKETAVVPSSLPSAAKSVGNVVIVEGAQKKPLLASSCPGWVCYAEKTHPYVLPHLSRVKSAQALAGTMLKSVLSKRLGIGADRIWHLAVMPCFDKKLEASREELTDTTWGDNAGPHHHKGVRDVDCVITTKEILLLAEERGIDFLSLSKESPSSTRTTDIPFPDPKIARFLFPSQTKRPASEAGTSGGQLHFLLHSIAAQNPGSSIQTTRGRNADVIEYAVIDDTSGAILFKAARYYGFRNIQNLVRRLKPARPSRMPGGRPLGGARRPNGKAGGSGTVGALEYGYVEVMACPGGCTNGGGQVKVDDAVVMAKKGWHAIEGFKPGPQEQKMWLSEVDEAYFSDSSESLATQNRGDEPDALLVDGISSGYVKSVLEYWAQTMGVDLDRLVHTSFREVVSDVGRDRDKVSETERVIQLAGKIGGGW